MSNNLYWYSTAVRTYANLTGLNSLASNTSLAATVSRSTSGEQQTATIRLTNNSATNLAFFVRPEVTAGNGGA
jgi:exo-1,4-beta-D-glucosaminidase